MNGDDVDPDIRAFLTQTSAHSQRLAGEAPVSLSRRREIAEQVRRPWVTGGPRMATTDEIRLQGDGPAGGLGLRIYRPTAKAVLPVLLYIHGGGWTIFSLDTHDRLMREYAARAGCAVVGVDYSLSPEVRYPHALNEAVAAAEWIMAQGAAHGLDGSRMAMGGDSAGANLALATALRQRDAGVSAAALLLNYGAFDDAPRPSYDRYGGQAYMLTPGEMADFWISYRGDDRGPDPLARPLLADLHDLPPTFLCIAECDILADENLEMGARLSDSGVSVETRIYEGATHSFLEAVNISALADRALQHASDWLRTILKP